MQACYNSRCVSTWRNQTLCLRNNSMNAYQRPILVDQAAPKCSVLDAVVCYENSYPIYCTMRQQQVLNSSTTLVQVNQTQISAAATSSQLLAETTTITKNSIHCAISNFSLIQQQKQQLLQQNNTTSTTNNNNNNNLIIAGSTIERNGMPIIELTIVPSSMLKKLQLQFANVKIIDTIQESQLFQENNIVTTAATTVDQQTPTTTTDQPWYLITVHETAWNDTSCQFSRLSATSMFNALPSLHHSQLQVGIIATLLAVVSATLMACMLGSGKIQGVCCPHYSLAYRQVRNNFIDYKQSYPTLWEQFQRVSLAMRIEDNLPPQQRQFIPMPDHLLEMDSRHRQFRQMQARRRLTACASSSALIFTILTALTSIVLVAVTQDVIRNLRSEIVGMIFRDDQYQVCSSDPEVQVELSTVALQQGLMLGFNWAYVSLNIVVVLLSCSLTCIEATSCRFLQPDFEDYEEYEE